jgi:hypothetical protein
MFDSVNAPIIRQEVARRALAYGESGAQVTEQSGRAKDLKSAAQSFSRYQSANGSVDYYYNKQLGVEDKLAVGKPASKGNFGTSVPSGPLAGGVPGLATGAGGGFGGFGGGRQGGANGGVNRGRSGAPDGVNQFGLNQLSESTRNAITLQVVKDRTFYRQSNNVWQDQSYDTKKNRLFRVQAFSDAHFALLKSAPQLAAYSSVGDELIVRIGNNAVQIGKTGKEKLTGAELKEILGK